MLRASEAIAVTVGVVAAAALRADALGVSAFDDLQTAYLGRGVSAGHWVRTIAGAREVLKSAAEPVAGLRAALNPSKGQPLLIDDLNSVVAERNRWAHLAGPDSAADAESRIGEMAPSLERSLRRAQFLANAPWTLVKSCSFRRGSGDFSIVGYDAMSDHPDFERNDFVSAQPLAQDTVYMSTDAGHVDLTPFIVMHDCPECRQAELCYADRLDPKKGVALKSFARGHTMFDTALEAEVRQLFGVA